MTRPTFRMLSSTKPDDHSCEATFKTGEYSMSVQTTNKDAHAFWHCLAAAYDEGRRDALDAILHEFTQIVRRQEAA